MHKQENKIIRKKLDELIHLPDGYDPNIASKWELIDAALENRKPKRKTFFYWTAAAAVVILFVGLFLLNLKPQIMTTPSANEALVTQKVESKILDNNEESKPSLNNVAVIQKSELPKPAKTNSKKLENFKLEEAATIDHAEELVQIDTPIDETSSTEKKLLTNIKKKKIFQKDFQGLGELVEPSSTPLTRNFRYQLFPSFPKEPITEESHLLRIKF